LIFSLQKKSKSLRSPKTLLNQNE